MKKRVLFVDDEPNALDGLRRMLRPSRQEWEAEFVPSGQAALTLLESAPAFDAVVTDMMMPGMDGVELLGHIRTRWPGMLRLVLSGRTDTELALRALGPAHQFLSKPCDGELLMGTIRRALKLRELLATGKASEIVPRLDKLPSLPGAYRRLLEQLNSPDVSIDEVGKIIKEDPAMTVRILKLVNSSFFGFAQHITDPTQAAMILGVNTIKSLVLAAQVFSQLETGMIEQLHIGELQTHSLAVATFARRIVEFEHGNRETIDEAFLAGLLHDIGKLILAANLPELYGSVILTARRDGLPLHEVERDAFGATHAEIGAFLLGIWAFPAVVIEAVGFHHSPALAQVPSFSPLVAAHAADFFVHESNRRPAARLGLKLDMEVLTLIDCSRHVEQWRAACGKTRGPGMDP